MKRIRAKQQRRPLMVVILLFLQAVITRGQNAEVNTRVVDCPNSVPALMGYDQLRNVVSDQFEEWQRIQNGATPRPPYVFRLCPNTQFNASEAPLMVLLSGSMFTCGPNTASTDNCVISDGFEQVVIEDSTIVEGYSLGRTSFVGITFEGFTGSSINAYASMGTIATFIDTQWQNFEGNSVVNLGTRNGIPDGEAMTVEISGHSNVKVRNMDNARCVFRTQAVPDTHFSFLDK
jgi:hypothetical protein